MIQSRPAQGLQKRMNSFIAIPQSEGRDAGCNADSARTSSGPECPRIFHDGSYTIRSIVTDISTIAPYL